MDRTEASDAFNAGSIPVGCTLSYAILYHRKFYDVKYAPCGREFGFNLKGWLLFWIRNSS